VMAEVGKHKEGYKPQGRQVKSKNLRFALPFSPVL
jgi:hypothetical protein